MFTRADTLENDEQDSSAMQRFMSWKVAWNVATAYPFTGAGIDFEMANDGRWLSFGSEKYSTCFGTHVSSAAHSIYFQILEQHGFVAFFVYILLLVSVQLKLNRLRRDAKKYPNSTWIGTYATGLQIGLAGYLVSGAFLSSAYFDLPWLYYAVTVMLSREFATQTSPATAGSTPIATRNAVTVDRA